MCRIIGIATLLIGSICYGQDYFAVVVQDDHVTYNYPANAIFTLTNEQDEVVEILKDDSTLVTGDYTLTVEVPWKSTPEMIRSNGGSLEIFILPVDIRKETNKGRLDWKTLEVSDKIKPSSKPYLESKSYAMSENGKQDAYFVFSNGMVVRFESGAIRAYQDGEQLSVKGNYLITGTDYVLKLSYSDSSGEFWYVFEPLVK